VKGRKNADIGDKTPPSGKCGWLGNTSRLKGIHTVMQMRNIFFLLNFNPWF